jgi:O-antigen ligase
MLGAHMHNSYLHSLYQSGFIGVIPFVAALVLTWLLLLKAVINLRNLPVMHRHLVIQSAGIIVFFSARTITESTAAFFGIDWLLLAPIMIYLQTASNMQPQQEKEA